MDENECTDALHKRPRHRVSLKKIPLRTNRFSGLPQIIHRVLFALFLGQFALVGAALWLPLPRLADARWPEGLLAVLATATTLASLARELPGQNVMLASIIIAVIAGAAQTIGALTGVPFGPYVYTENLGQLLFYPLPWAVPLVWLVAILSSRGVARLILRSSRRSPAYGFWLIGLTGLLVVVLDFGLEPFATSVKHYWLWNPSKTALAWYTVPWVNFVGWAVTALLILAFVTPVLINKKPIKQPPVYHPLIVWVLLNSLFSAAASLHQLWPAAAVSALASLVTAAFAVLGARRQSG